MLKNFWRVLVIGMLPIICNGVPIAQTWSEVKKKSKEIRIETDKTLENMKKIKNATDLIAPALEFIGDLKVQMPQLVELMDSLSKTLKNLSEVSGKKYTDPAMRKQTLETLFTNSLQKSDELFNGFFAILYGLDSIIMKAAEIKLLKPVVSDQFKQALLACRSFALVTMKFFEERLGPDLINFLYRLETITPTIPTK